MRMGLIELNENDLVRCLSLPNEKIILAKRKHPLIPIAISTSILFTGLFTTGLLVYLLSITLQSAALTISFALILLTLTSFAISKAVIDWYFHIYIVTNRKILEIKCIPFFSDTIDDVFLDQVRTTEVDTAIPNFIHELLDIGSVTVAFDRPSHDEVYTLSNIKNPRETANLLADSLENLMRPASVWFNPKKSNDFIKFNEDTYEKVAHA